MQKNEKEKNGGPTWIPCPGRNTHFQALALGELDWRG